MSDTVQPTAAAAEEEDEDVLTFSTDDSDGGDAEPDTATTEPPAEEAAEPQAGSAKPEKGPAQSEATAAPDETENKQTAQQQPTSAPVDEEEAIRRRQARFGLAPAKPVATGVHQGGVAKRSGNAFAGAMNQQTQGPGRGRGFLGNRGRGVGSFRGRGGRGPAMQTHAIGSANMGFGPAEAPIRAPRPPAYPPPALGNGLAQQELMGNAFAGIKDRKPAKPTGHTAAPGMAAQGASLQNAFNGSATFNATAPPFRPRMPSSQNSGRGQVIMGSGQIGMPPASQVAKASTWIRSEAAAQPTPQASVGANLARLLESKPVATASTWINPKLKQNAGQVTKSSAVAAQNAARSKQSSAAAPSSGGADDKDAEIMALKARLEALERGKRKAEDDGEVARGYNAAGSGASNGKRFRQTQSAVMPSEPMPTAGNGRSKMGILERVQFGAQRSGSGNGKAHMGGAVHDARDDDPQQWSHQSGDMRHRQKPRTGSPGGREQRRRAPEPDTSTSDFSDIQKRRMDRFAARG